VWDRLPLALRIARTLQLGVVFGVVFLLVGSVLVMKITSAQGDIPQGAHVWVALGTLIAGLGLLIGGLVGAVGITHWFCRGAGPEQDELKLLSASNTAPFWERPGVAPLLAPVTRFTGGAGEPRTVAELVARIEEMVAALPATPMITDAANAARRLAKTLAGLDRERAQLGKDFDPAQLAQVERQLAGFGAAEDTGSRRQMRELLEGQRQLLEKLAGQRDSVGRRQEHLLGLLRTLWLQMAALRAGAAREQLEDAAVSGRVREVCLEIAAQVAATEEVQAALATVAIRTPTP